jgi:hypothetical protein
MKYLIQILEVLFCVTLVLVFESCEKENMFDCFKSTGNIKVEKRMLPSFTEVEVQNNINVIFIQDSLTFAEASAGENLLPLIVTEVEEGRLLIENHNTCNWVRDFSVPIDVYVHLPQLIKLKTYGSGKISSLGTLRCNIIEADNRGTGDIELAVDAVEVYSKHGIGDNTFTGNANYLYVYNTSFGYSFCSGLKVNRATVINLASGNSFVDACDNLDAEIKGSGNIFYTGSPVIHSTIIGTGLLIQD